MLRQDPKMLRNLLREVAQNETFLRLGDLHSLCDIHEMDGFLGFLVLTPPTCWQRLYKTV